MSEEIIDKVEGFLRGILTAYDIELVEVQYRIEAHGWVLRVLIDTEAGVTLEDCSGVSSELGHYLDMEDCIAHAYQLEVSSPGLERPLRSIDDFRRFCGEKARVKMHQALDGRKVFEGTIGDVINDYVHLNLVDGTSIRFTLEMLNKARLAI